jgi:DNA polymerase III alpha subunit (gram-positive type)
MILEQPLAFIDIETTGTDRDAHEILELGVVIARMKDGVLTVTGELDLKVQPKHIETAEATALRINGYNEADWLFAVSLEEAMRVFVEKTKGAIFLAHNITFDFPFIEKALKDTNQVHDMHFHKIDTLSLAFGVLHQTGDVGKLSLRMLCEQFGIENKKAHSAFADAYATYEVFKKLMKLR